MKLMGLSRVPPNCFEFDPVSKQLTAKHRFSHENPVANDQFGWAIDTKRLPFDNSGTSYGIISAKNHTVSGYATGAAFVFGLSPFSAGEGINRYATIHNPELSGTAASEFGESVTLDLLDYDSSIGQFKPFYFVGAPAYDNGSDQHGAVFTYNLDGEHTQTLLPQESTFDDRFGAAIDADSGLLVVGVPGADVVGNNSGNTELFQYRSINYFYLRSILPDWFAAGDQFGSSVSASVDFSTASLLDDMFYIGAPGANNHAGAVQRAFYNYSNFKTSGSSVQITVTPVNDPPTLLGSENTIYIPEQYQRRDLNDDLLIATFETSDVDSTSFTYEILDDYVLAQPSNIFYFDGNDLKLRWYRTLPYNFTNASANSDSSVQIRVTDNVVAGGTAESDTKTFELVVLNETLELYDQSVEGSEDTANVVEIVDLNTNIEGDAIIESVTPSPQSGGEVVIASDSRSFTYKPPENSTDPAALEYELRMLLGENQSHKYGIEDSLPSGFSLTPGDGKEGTSIATDGVWTLSGAPEYYGSRGRVGAYQLIEDNWVLVQNLSLPSTVTTTLDRRFGESVAIHGNYAIVGSPHDDQFGEDAGSAQIYELVDGFWSYVTTLSSANANDGDLFGTAVAIDGDYAFLGAQHGRNGSDLSTGTVTVY